MTKASIPAFDEAWDDETVGADPSSMKVVDEKTAAALDDASGTQLISIRMQKSMVDAFKAIAATNKGIGYQTLMKQILQRFIDSEMKRVWNEHLAEQLAREQEKASPPAKTGKERPRKAA